MTATNDAPDRTPDTTEERWQRIQDKITDLERRVHETGSAAIAAIDTRLAHLDALRQSLARDPWPPRPAPATATNTAPTVPPHPTGAESRPGSPLTTRHPRPDTSTSSASAGRPGLHTASSWRLVGA